MEVPAKKALRVVDEVRKTTFVGFFPSPVEAFAAVPSGFDWVRIQTFPSSAGAKRAVLAFSLFFRSNAYSLDRNVLRMICEKVWKSRFDEEWSRVANGERFTKLQVSGAFPSLAGCRPLEEQQSENVALHFEFRYLAMFEVWSDLPRSLGGEFFSSLFDLCGNWKSQVVDISTDMGIKDLRKLFSNCDDCHYLSGTLNYADLYTGERDFSDESDDD